MNAATSAAAAEKSLPLKSAVETEISNFVEQESPKRPAQIENDAERIRSSVARLTSNSIAELEGLTSELQELQEFLKSEVERVQREIENALAGIKIIIETIAPWKNTAELASASKERPRCSWGPGGKYCFGVPAIREDGNFNTWGSTMTPRSIPIQSPAGKRLARPGIRDAMFPLSALAGRGKNAPAGSLGAWRRKPPERLPRAARGRLPKVANIAKVAMLLRWPPSVFRGHLRGAPIPSHRQIRLWPALS